MKDLEYKVIKRARNSKEYEDMLIAMLAENFDIGLDNPAKDIDREDS